MAAGVQGFEGFARMEPKPAAKHCLETKVPLPQSIIWQIQERLLSTETSWEDFGAARSKLAKDYARAIFHFLRDTYAPAHVSQVARVPQGRCLVLEIGAAHGQFTCLLLRSLLQFKPYFQGLGMPAQPFIVLSTNQAVCAVDGCRDNGDLDIFVQEGWLDFAVFDANQPPNLEELRELAGKHGCIDAEVPTILVCNDILGFLTQEALQLGGSQVPCSGCLSVFSDQELADLDSEAITAGFTSQLTFGWDWEECPELLEAAERAAAHGMAEEARLAFVKAYLAQSNPSADMTIALLPLGAFRLIHAIHRLAGSQLLLFASGSRKFAAQKLSKTCEGNKGALETAGWENLQFAIHGQFSFAVNFEALQLLFDHHGGFSVQTPYRDSMPCGLYCLGARESYPSLLSAAEDMRYDFGQSPVMFWSPSLSDALLHSHLAPGQDHAKLLVRGVLHHLRNSCHDAEVFWQIHPLLLHEANASKLGSEGIIDFAFDLDQVYSNRIQTCCGNGARDLAFAIGECLMQVGCFAQAARYFRCSREEHGACTQVLLQLSSCLQATGLIDEAMEAAREALLLDPSSSAARAQLQNLEMSANSLGCALIGGGLHNSEQSGPLLAQNLQLCVKAVFAFGEDEARALGAALEKARQALKKMRKSRDVSRDTPISGDGQQRLRILWGSEGLEEVLQRRDIQVCVVDVHHKVLPLLLPKFWSSRKHVMSHSPLAFDLEAAKELYTTYQALPDERPVWHVIESNLFEDALTNANESLEKLGRPLCISMAVLSAYRGQNAKIAMLGSAEERMSIDLVHGLVAVLRVMGKDKLRKISCHAGKLADAGADRQMGTLAGHFVVSPAAESTDSCQGTFMVCSRGSEPGLEVRFFCQRGALVLKREKSAWQMTVTDDRGGVFGRRSLERSVPCVGVRGSHRAFLAQVRAGGGCEIDPSIEHALVDTAILRSILRSQQAGGASVGLKYSN